MSEHRPHHQADAPPAEDRPMDSVLVPAPPAPRKPYVVPLTVAVTAGAIALVMGLGSSLGSGTATPAATVTVTRTVGTDESTLDGSAGATTSPAQGVDVARRAAGDPLALGTVDAPVVMVEYSDFSCPYCASFAVNTEPKLIAKYVDSGVLRIEWRDFPYLTDQSGVAAIVARAAADQGKFWPVHDALFRTMHAQGFDKLDTSVIAKIASGAGLSSSAFATAFTATATASAVSADLGEGQKIGVTGTPSFVINGRLVVGAQDLATFEQIIDQAAAAAR